MIMPATFAMLMAATSIGLADEPKKDAPTPPPPPPASSPAPNAQPTLDELLGIKPSTAPADAKPQDAPKPGDKVVATDENKAELDRLLTAEEMGDAFKQAVALMGDASTRLNDAKDPGVQTQRIQEDVIRRLDQLLASLNRQQQQQQQQQQSQQDQQQSQKNVPQQSRAQQQQQQQPQNGDGNNPADGPTLKAGKLNAELESARAAWGSLPARVREMLLQGSADRFSARHRALTEEYYKRLAEEAGK